MRKFALIKDGVLTPAAKNISTAIAIGLIVYIHFFGDFDDLTTWLLASAAIVFGYGSAWAGLMHKWGYKPFTNDPVSWRKAKKSYEVGKAPPTKKPGLLARLLGRK